MRLLRWLGIAVIALAVLAGALFAIARFSGPIGPLPGGHLRGELVEGSVADWSKVLPEGWVALEVDPESPHSVTTSYILQGRKLYVPAMYGASKVWPATAMRDGRVVLRAGAKLYPLQAVRVTDPGEVRAIVRPIDGDPAAPEFHTWYFRLEPRS